MTTIPSFATRWRDGNPLKPRIRIIEVHDQEQIDKEPIAWILVEREEVFQIDEGDKSIFRASIRLRYARILPKHSRYPASGGEFCGSYENTVFAGEVASITSHDISKGVVFLDPGELRGQHIGTYLMNEVVAWVRQWPEAIVQPVELVINQAQDGNKDRRNKFYEQFGLIFDYTNSRCEEGLSRKVPAGSLKCVESWRKNIKEVTVPEFMADLLYSKKWLEQDLERRKRANESLASELDRIRAKPLRWALGFFFKVNAPFYAALLLALGLAALAWFRIAA
jgi:hypothetical protein